MSAQRPLDAMSHRLRSPSCDVGRADPGRWEMGRSPTNHLAVSRTGYRCSPTATATTRAEVSVWVMVIITSVTPSISAR